MMKYDYYKVLKEEVEKYMASNGIGYKDMKGDRFDLIGLRDEFFEDIRENLCHKWFYDDEEKAKQAVMDNRDLLKLTTYEDPDAYDFIMLRLDKGHWMWLDEIIRETLLPYVIESIILETVCSHVENNGED